MAVNIERKSELIKAVVYGANDGMITTFAVVAGVAGAKLSPLIVLILGISNIVADGISMGLSDYIGNRSQNKFLRSIDKKISNEGIWQTSLVTFLGFVLAGMLPMTPYILEYVGVGFWSDPFLASIVATGFAMFMVGSLRTLITKGHWIANGLEMLMIGALASGSAYFLGYLVEKIVSTGL